MIASAIKNVIPIERIGKLRVLEFGCGSCEGAQHLCQFGNLVVTDIYRHPLLNLPPGLDFRIVDIHETDFKDNEFDILVSSQVLEHLENLEKAFREMRRIAKENAYYVFAIPTTFWLVLSIPGQIFKRVENIATRIKARNPKSKEAMDNRPGRVSTEEPDNAKNGWLSKFAIHGHACYPGFFECFKAFRIRNWRNVLSLNGLEVVKEAPLLNYTGYVPFIPPNRFLAKLGFASSYLFICKEADSDG